MRNTKQYITVVCVLILPLLAACTQDNTHSKRKGRWYTEAQVNQGKAVFETHCIACHKKNAAGTRNWKIPLLDGFYPPPPLNGSAHAWHHRLSVLKRTIDEGGAALEGTMPGFKDRISAAEKDAVIAYFQDFWSDEIYSMWLERGGLD